MGVENLDELNRRLDEFADKIVPQKLVLMQKKLSLQIFAGVILLTPVDEGEARGGWQLQVGSVPTGVTGEFDDAVDASESPTYRAGVGNLRSLRKIGQTVFIANNVEHIIWLEEGKPGPGSDQSPDGMVAVTIENVLEQFR